MKIAETNSGIGWYLNNETQSHNVFDYLLEKCNGADRIIVSSFAITEAYVRRIIRNRHRIAEIELLLDFTIASRNPRVTNYAANNVDRLFLTNNHAKFIYIEKGDEKYVAGMSNNATNNHRFEFGYILSDPELISDFAIAIEEMKKHSVLFG
jgi:hypothetical protein